MRRPFQQYGFTLVELLVAGTIMVLILSALGSLFASTTKAYRANDKVSERQQSVDAAGQLLEYEIGLAGYKGSTDAAGARKFETAVLGVVPVPESTLRIEKNSPAIGTDRVTVRYYEDRFENTPVKKVVSFEVGEDDRNTYNLKIRVDSGNFQPAIQDVKSLKVLKYIKKDGGEVTSVSQPDDLAALRLELTFTDALKKQVIIGLNNPQNVPVLPPL